RLPRPRGQARRHRLAGGPREAQRRGDSQGRGRDEIAAVRRAFRLLRLHLMKAFKTLRDRTRAIARQLRRLYPEAQCALHYENPLQLLVATILSAQCTDVRVNMVTPALFQKYPDARGFAQADSKELETAIQSTGFFRNKARNIIACCKQMVEQH